MIPDILKPFTELLTCPRKEALLYYLYMMCDGEVSYSEEITFNTICAELRIEDQEIEEIISECEGFVQGSGKIIEIIKREELETSVGRKWPGMMNATHCARIIWNLVNLGYSDTQYSENEKEIVSYLVDTWGVDRDVFQEMIDTSETILALIKQKEWVFERFANEKSERDDRVKKIDLEIDKMVEDIKITISELNYQKGE